MNSTGIRAGFLVLLVFAIVTGAASGDVLERADPASAGMSVGRLERLEELGRSYVDSGKLAGVMTMVARHGEIVHLSAAGTYGVGDDRAISEDTLFRIYSMTKPITAVALMTLYEQGAFQIDDPVSKFLPEFGEMKVWKGGRYQDAERPITLHHLLTHTAGLTYGAGEDNPVDPLYRDAKLLDAANLDEFVDRLAAIPLLFEPGERWHYSVAYDVLGAVAERISGRNYADFLAERVFEPLGMDDTFFAVPAAKRDRFAINHVWDPEAKRLVALGDDAPLNRSFSGASFYSGGGGLVSTIGDYMKFAEMLRNGGKLGSVRILGPKTVEYMLRNHVGATSGVALTGESPTVDVDAEWRGIGFGLGFGLVNDPAVTGVVSSRGTYFWGGYAGTIFWVDPEEELVGIGMMQLMASPWPFRKEMMVATYQAVDQLNGACEGGGPQSRIGQH